MNILTCRGRVPVCTLTHTREIERREDDAKGKLAEAEAEAEAERKGKGGF